MIGRDLEAVIEGRLDKMPGVVLLGPRQIGKTTLARAVANRRGRQALYLDLERPADRNRLADPESYLKAQAGKLVVLDEIHQMPNLFAILRGVIDERRAQGEKAGHFLLLGSAALDLMRQASETLAGRVAYLELTPITAAEYGSVQPEIERLWIRGGFPESLLAESDQDSFSWRQDFIRSYLERDVPMFAPRLPAEAIGRLWRMLAHAQGSLLNQSRLASSLAVSVPAVGRYIDLLVDLLLVRRLRPWSGNVGKRLVRSPKTYIRDSGLVHALLDLETLNDVLGHSIAGPSWEGFVLENLITAAGSRRMPCFYRTEDGAEIDLVFERGGDVETAIEIKRMAAPKISRGFHLACEKLRPAAAFIVHSGTESWPAAPGVTAISLAGLMAHLAG